MTATLSPALMKKVSIEEFGIVTKKDFMEKAKRKGWKVSSEITNGYKDNTFNRRHFNRLTGTDQDKYDARMKKEKQAFSIGPDDGHFSYDISKREFEYFNTLN